MRRSNRLVRSLDLVLEVVQENSQISYDNICMELAGAGTPLDRWTVIQAVGVLERRRKIVRVPGAGRVPNRYISTEKVLITD